MMKDVGVKILFAGDVMLGENIYHFGRSIRTKFNGKYENFIPKAISDKLFAESDALFYNFEHSLVPDDYIFQDIHKSIYVAPVNSLKTFPERILKIASIANNHFCQHGAQRTKYTIDALKKNKFIVVGENHKPVKLSIRGRNVLLWGVTLVNRDRELFCSSYNALMTDIEVPAEKGPNDVWIISVHWGTEYMSYPDSEQRMLAKQLADVGFDIVHGHHPHVFQPFEWINKTLIMHSLGNFIFDQNFSKKTQLSVLPYVNCEPRRLGLEVFEMKSKRYQPNSIRKLVSIENLILKEQPFYSNLKRFLKNQKYRALAKLEFLPYVAKNKFLVFKYLYSRYKRS